MANWNNKAATADDVDGFGRTHRTQFILEALADDASWTRADQRQLNEDVAGLEGRGRIGQILVPRLREAVDALGNGGVAEVDAVLAAARGVRGGAGARPPLRRPRRGHAGGGRDRVPEPAHRRPRERDLRRRVLRRRRRARRRARARARDPRDRRGRRGRAGQLRTAVRGRLLRQRLAHRPSRRPRRARAGRHSGAERPAGEPLQPPARRPLPGALLPDRRRPGTAASTSRSSRSARS